MQTDIKKNAVEAFQSLETPALLLDIDRLRNNANVMRKRCAELGVRLRPHLKTSKSLNVAEIATGGTFGSITVSTIKEAEYFARGGYRDIMYAVAIAERKLAHIERIQRETGARILIVVDTIEAATMVAGRAPSFGQKVHCLIEVDCGEHRSGVPPQADQLVPIARILSDAPGVALEGVMTHAGHSYSSADRHVVEAIAEAERRAAVDAADILRRAGLDCAIVSVGSTPTVLFARHLEGVTEVRCGIYLFWDLAQLSRNVCRQDDIAVSVLASVIGHNRTNMSVIVDAGALALSKDLGANANLPDVKYGYVCDPVSLERLGALSLDVVHQEHGTITVPTNDWFDRLPIGGLVRVLPNHACLTCAAYDKYRFVVNGELAGTWPKINGW
ncbi:MULTISPECIES: alanine racemase [unclassified Bradyrhizobium]|uniref:alanine racemase n=1 Tax=unclassified Bradyrhizobium TaxID=2631580 RepID=UPI0028EE65FA|nr:MULTISPECIES: alanine racemase [unclassified Bradyrhizobium]